MTGKRHKCRAAETSINSKLFSAQDRDRIAHRGFCRSGQAAVWYRQVIQWLNLPPLFKKMFAMIKPDSDPGLILRAHTQEQELCWQQLGRDLKWGPGKIITIGSPPMSKPMSKPMQKLMSKPISKPKQNLLPKLMQNPMSKPMQNLLSKPMQKPMSKPMQNVMSKRMM